MSDVRMPVKVWLPANVYQALFKAATKRGFADVGSFLAYQADLACRPPKQRHSYTKVTDEILARIVTLRARGFSIRDISTEVGVSAASVYKHLQKAS